MLLVFVRGKEEQFVFHDRSTEREAVSLCCLIGELHLLVQELVVAAIQVLVGVISKGGSSEFVGTRLCNGIDCTTRESTLANVERRHGDLDLVDGVERNGVGARLATVGAAGSETKHIVGHHTVNLERVVAVVGAVDGDAAVAVDVDHG